jgi:hypothetical protein
MECTYKDDLTVHNGKHSVLHICRRRKKFDLGNYVPQPGHQLASRSSLGVTGQVRLNFFTKFKIADIRMALYLFLSVRFSIARIFMILHHKVSTGLKKM